MKIIAIAGVGLIGASFALALKKAGFSGEIVGVSSPASIEAGMEVGAITRGVSLNEAAAHADLIYLAQPIDVILQTIEILGPSVRPDCLVTDAGSTKTQISLRASQYFVHHNFLGGHPMAGKEKRGAREADADLFRGRPYVLTLESRDVPYLDELTSWLLRIGANVIYMSPEHHDATVAMTSHLPQLLSTALAATLAEQQDPYLASVFGPGLIDMTRLSLSAPEVWMSVLATNKEAITGAIRKFQTTLSDLEAKLRTEEIAKDFTSAAAFSRTLRKLPVIQ